MNLKPLVSVIICAYNEENGIAKTISAVLDQTYPRDRYEIVVVDNASTDKTSDIAKSLGARVVLEPRKGIAYARQKGSEEAKGEIIAFTDADTVVPNDWLDRLIKSFEEDKKLVAFGGTYRITTGSSLSKFVMNHGMYYLYLFAKIVTGGWVLIGPNMAYRKWAFEKTGGFDIHLSQGEDTDISQKLQKIGRVKVVNGFYVYQSGRRFEKGLIKGLLSYGINWPMKVFFHINTSKKLQDFR